MKDKESNKKHFNKASREESENLNQVIADLRQELTDRLEALKGEQILRKSDDMEKAKQRILQDQKTREYSPPGVQRRYPGSSWLDEQAKQCVETQNLRESNQIRGHYKDRIDTATNIEHSAEHKADSARKSSPREIGSIFNGLSQGRDGPERER